MGHPFLAMLQIFRALWLSYTPYVSWQSNAPVRFPSRRWRTSFQVAVSLWLQRLDKRLKFLWINFVRFESLCSTKRPRVWPLKCASIWIFINMRPLLLFFKRFRDWESLCCCNFDSRVVSLQHCLVVGTVVCAGWILGEFKVRERLLVVFVLFSRRYCLIFVCWRAVGFLVWRFVAIWINLIWEWVGGACGSSREHTTPCRVQSLNSLASWLASLRPIIKSVVNRLATSTSKVMTLGYLAWSRPLIYLSTIIHYLF